MGTRDDYLYPEEYGTRAVTWQGWCCISRWLGGDTGAGWAPWHCGWPPRPGGKAIKQTVDNGLVAEAMRLDGVSADDDHQMQVHPYRLPDELPVEYCRFSRASLEQLQHYFCRKLAESFTVDTLIVDLSGGAFEPGDPFPACWDAKASLGLQGHLRGQHVSGGSSSSTSATSCRGTSGFTRIVARSGCLRQISRSWPRASLPR